MKFRQLSVSLLSLSLTFSPFSALGGLGEDLIALGIDPSAANMQFVSQHGVQALQERLVDIRAAVPAAGGPLGIDIGAVHQMMQDIGPLRQNFAATQAQLPALQGQIAALQQTLNTTNEQKAALEQRLAALQQEAGSSNQQAISSLQQQIEEIEAQRAVSQQQLVEVSAQRDSVTQQLANFTQENSSLQQQILTLGEQKSATEAEFASIAQARDELAHQLQSALDSARSEISSQREGLERAVDSHREEIEVLQAQITSLEASSREEIERRIRSLEEDFGSARDDLEREKEDAFAYVRGIEDKKRDLEEKLRELESSLSDQREKLAGLEGENQNLRSRVEEGHIGESYDSDDVGAASSAEIVPSASSSRALVSMPSLKPAENGIFLSEDLVRRLFSSGTSSINLEELRDLLHSVVIIESQPRQRALPTTVLVRSPSFDTKTVASLSRTTLLVNQLRQVWVQKDEDHPLANALQILLDAFLETSSGWDFKAAQIHEKISAAKDWVLSLAAELDEARRATETQEATTDNLVHQLSSLRAEAETREAALRAAKDEAAQFQSICERLDQELQQAKVQIEVFEQQDQPKTPEAFNGVPRIESFLRDANLQLDRGQTGAASDDDVDQDKRGGSASSSPERKSARGDEYWILQIEDLRRELETANTEIKRKELDDPTVPFQIENAGLHTKIKLLEEENAKLKEKKKKK